MILSSKVFQVFAVSAAIFTVLLSATGALADGCCSRQSGRLDDGSDQTEQAKDFVPTLNPNPDPRGRFPSGTNKQYTPPLRQPDDGPINSQGSGTR